jgi:hypothetical protein
VAADGHPFRALTRTPSTIRRLATRNTPPVVHPVANHAFAAFIDELGLTALREAAERALGHQGLPWYVS